MKSFTRSKSICLVLCCPVDVSVFSPVIIKQMHIKKCVKYDNYAINKYTNFCCFFTMFQKSLEYAFKLVNKHLSKALNN